MSLELIVGPNLGRAGEILGRLRSALERDPLLVVPTGDDIARFERDLRRGDRPAIGATIRTFGSLTDEIATIDRNSGATGPDTATATRAIRAATASAPLRVLRRFVALQLRGRARPADRGAASRPVFTPPTSGAPRRRPAARPTSSRSRRSTARTRSCATGPGWSDAGSLARAAAVALRAAPDSWFADPS